MRYSTSVMIVAALGIGEAVAGPTHAHMHRHRHQNQKKDGVDWNALNWNDMGIDWTSAWAAGQATSTVAPVVAPVATTAAPVIASSTKVAAPAPATTTSASTSSSNSIVSDAESLFDGLVGLANNLVAFGESTASSGSDVGKIGNIGNPQGSNIIKVDSTEGYPFTGNFINTSGSPITVVFWNKAFSNDGSAENAEANLGSCVASKTPALTIALAPGASQIVAFQEDSQVGFAQAIDPSTGLTPSGAYATTWGEINCASGGSGFDMSAINNPKGNNYNMALSALETPCISDPTQNYWYAEGNNWEDPKPFGNSDGSCYVPGNSMTLTVKMGGPMS